MPFDLSQPDLDVWEKTFLPTSLLTKSDTESSKTLGVLYSPRFLEDGTTEFQRLNCSVKETELLFSHPEECTNYLHSTTDTQKMESKPTTLASMVQRLNQDLSTVEMKDVNISDAWQQILSYSEDTPSETDSGDLPTTSSKLASAIRRTISSFLIWFK